MKVFVSFLFIVLSFCGLNAIDKELQSELLQMMENDQAARNAWINEKDAVLREQFKQKVIALDYVHLPRAKAILKEYGWPGVLLVGEEGSHAFWLLVQHAPDAPFQNRALELLEKAVALQDASMIDYAYLKDRVLMQSDKDQIYGTQLNKDLSFYPIADKEHVNERRLAIGLSTLEEYHLEIKKMYGNKL